MKEVSVVKKTKRVIALLVAAFMAAAVVGCNGKDEKDKITKDSSVMGLSFTIPKEYETVERITDLKSDGSLKEKNLKYTFSDESSVAYAFALDGGQNLDDLLSGQNVEKKEYSGNEYYLYISGNSYMALKQIEHHIYGVQYNGKDKETVEEEFNKIMETVKISDAAETAETAFDDISLDKVKFTIDKELNVCGNNISVVVKPDETLVKKSVVWRFGKDEENIDFRFLIRVFKNTTVEEETKEDKEYIEEEVNGVKYTVLKPAEGKAAYEYYTQQGHDVFEIRNNGKDSGWSVIRSEESETAFRKFLESISF